MTFELPARRRRPLLRWWHWLTNGHAPTGGGFLLYRCTFVTGHPPHSPTVTSFTADTRCCSCGHQERWT